MQHREKNKKQNLKMAKSKNEKDRKMRNPWWINKSKTRKCEQHRKLMRNEDKKERMNKYRMNEKWRKKKN